MRDLVRLIVWIVADLFRSRTALEVQIWMLRQQINVLRRTAPKKQTFSAVDRLIFVCLYRLLSGFATRWRLLSRRLWSNGIAPASVYIDDGNRKRGVAGR